MATAVRASPPHVQHVRGVVAHVRAHNLLLGRGLVDLHHASGLSRHPAPVPHREVLGGPRGGELRVPPPPRQGEDLLGAHGLHLKPPSSEVPQELLSLVLGLREDLLEGPLAELHAPSLPHREGEGEEGPPLQDLPVEAELFQAGDPGLGDLLSQGVACTDVPTVGLEDLRAGGDGLDVEARPLPRPHRQVEDVPQGPPLGLHLARGGKENGGEPQLEAHLRLAVLQKDYAVNDVQVRDVPEQVPDPALNPVPLPQVRGPVLRRHLPHYGRPPPREGKTRRTWE